MELIDSFDHQTGVHCGAAAIRNLTRHYGWEYTEAASFGIGGGPAFLQYTAPESAWARVRTSPIWLVHAFFERTGIPHLSRSGDDFTVAWENVAARVEHGDPVVVFLDPERLEYLSAEPAHLPPHVAVVIGYDDDSVILSDAAVEERQEIALETLQEAWSHDGIVPMENEYLVVTRSSITEDGTDAVADGLRQTATYMIDPVQVERNARGAANEGIAALHGFADTLGAWADMADPEMPVQAARRAIDEHGEGAAFRGLYADSLEELGRRTDLSPDLAGRMNSVAGEWRRVADMLDDILTEAGRRPATFEETASLVVSIADSEAAIFEDLATELGKAGTLE